MSLSTAIGMVSTTLRNLLLGEMLITPAVPVTILAPDETGVARRINLFLYKIQENAALRNSDWHVKATDSTKLVPPPLSLNLFYLMTAYAANDAESGNSAVHEILGDAMRVFYENARIPQNYLENGLKGQREEIKITHNGLDLEELSRIWATFTKPFRPSILYEVSVVQIDALEKNERPLPRRVRKIGVPTVAAPYLPPVVESMKPSNGPAGSTIMFEGNNFTGWKSTVTIGNREIPNSANPNGTNSIVASVPHDIKPGFYELSIDVAHLFKRIFLFEVTA